jgi:cation transport ATPase
MPTAYIHARCPIKLLVIKHSLDLALSHALSQTFKRPKRRKVREYLGRKLRQLVVTKIERAEKRSERKSGLTPSAWQLEGVCVRVCVFACTLSLVHLSVCARASKHADTSMYIFMSCYTCAIDIWRALKQAHARSNTELCISKYVIYVSDIHVCVFVWQTHTLSFPLSNTKATWAKKAPRIRGMEAPSACCYQDKAGWEEKRGRVSLTLVGITARRCVRVCECASCVCASSLSLMHLSVRACACIRAYIFLLCVGVRAHPSTIHTHKDLYRQHMYNCQSLMYMSYTCAVYVHTYAHMNSTHANKNHKFAFTNRHLCVHTLISGGKKTSTRTNLSYIHTYITKRYVHILTFKTICSHINSHISEAQICKP